MRSTLTVGDTLDFETTVTDYPATDGWTLTYRLVPRLSTGAVISFAASGTPSTPDAYRVQQGPSTTALWNAGEYSWSAYVSKTGARYTVENGLVTLQLDPAAAPAGTDTRSHARKVLEAIEAVLESRASKDQMSYTINGRELHRTPIPDLILLRSQYRAEVRAEDQVDRAAQGLPDRRRLGIRFSRI